MGRWAYAESGLNWEWKFGFSRQCSNLGFLLKEIEDKNNIFVHRYIGEEDEGEIVRLLFRKSKMLEALTKLKAELNKCPVCGDDLECIEDTKEMLESLKEAIEKEEGDWIEAQIYIEY